MKITLLFLTMMAFLFGNAQEKEFKLVYGQNELGFDNLDTLETSYFKEDTVKILYGIPDDVLYKYSLEGGKIMVRSYGKKLGDRKDTVYYFDVFQPVFNYNMLNKIRNHDVSEMIIITNLKTVKANYKVDKKSILIRVYLKVSE